MATNSTPYYHFPQWMESDPLLMTELNESFEDIDLTLHNLSLALSGASADDGSGKEITTQWSDLLTAVNNADFTGININDYKTILVGSGTTLHMEVAGIDTYYGLGGEDPIGHHIDFISREVYPVMYAMNTMATNNGNSDNNNPFMRTDLYRTLTETVYDGLPAVVKDVISPKKGMVEYRYMLSNTTLTDSNGWGWKEQLLWIPTEVEVFGNVFKSDAEWAGGAGLNTQYEIFKQKGAKSFLKKYNDISVNWWLSNAAKGNATSFCAVDLNGSANKFTATSTCYVPICFRIGG